MPAIEARLQAQNDAIEPRPRAARTPRFLGYRNYHRRLPSKLVVDAPSSRRRTTFANLGAIRKLLMPRPKTNRDKAILAKHR
jgi:hypothetical protein